MLLCCSDFLYSLTSCDCLVWFWLKSSSLPRYCAFFFLMIRRPPRSTLDRSSAASDVYKRQLLSCLQPPPKHPPWDSVPQIPILLMLNLGNIACNCLLYTSPSPRDRTRSRMPSSAWKKKTHITQYKTIMFNHGVDEVMYKQQPNTYLNRHNITQSIQWS